MLSRQALLRSVRAAAAQRAAVSQTRAYAAAAASEKVKPPVALFGLDGTYATALVRPSRTASHPCLPPSRPPPNWTPSPLVHSQLDSAINHTPSRARNG